MGADRKEGRDAATVGEEQQTLKTSMITPARSRPVSERGRVVQLEKWASCSRVVFRCFPFCIWKESPAKSGHSTEVRNRILYMRMERGRDIGRSPRPIEHEKLDEH